MRDGLLALSKKIYVIRLRTCMNDVYIGATIQSPPAITLKIASSVPYGLVDSGHSKSRQSTRSWHKFQCSLGHQVISALNLVLRHPLSCHLRTNMRLIIACIIKSWPFI